MNTALAPRKHKAALSLTPLIDVVFILLLFFMLTSSFSQETTINLSVPVAATAPTQALVSQLVLAVNGQFSALNSSSLLTVIDLQAMAFEAQSIVVRPRPEVSVQTLVDSLVFLQESGFSKISIGDITGASDE